LTEQYSVFVVSAITEYELYVGNSEGQNDFWDNFFSQITVLPFDTESVKQSINIHKQLKLKNKLIEIPDILIAGTAMTNKLPLATLNLKHFERIDGLEIVY
jgi:predicted nucleic acid-binding protein